MTVDITRKSNDTPASAPASEDDLALNRVHAAEALLPKDAPQSGLKGFFAALYGGAPPEDITRYAPESLAALAEIAFEKTAASKGGRNAGADLALSIAARNDRERNETILIVVNDDMPFLFDCWRRNDGAAYSHPCPLPSDRVH